jgi:hypothetical protein
MDHANINDVSALQSETSHEESAQLSELDLLQLALVGGGIADIIGI